MFDIMRKLWFYDVNFEMVTSDSRYSKFILSKTVNGVTYCRSLTLDMCELDKWCNNEAFTTLMLNRINEFINKVAEIQRQEPNVVWFATEEGV